MKVSPYLSFDGDCAEAFRLYESVLGGRIVALMPFRGSPMAEDVPPDWQDKIMHACLALEDQMVMGSDGIPGHHRPPAGFAVSLHMADPADAERVFDALAPGATIEMPLSETFWALKFGQLIDRFGTPWMVNCSRPD